MRALIILSILAASCMPTTVLAADQKVVAELVELDGKKPIVIKPDHAYLLFRVKGKWFAPVFLRIPTADEVVAFQAAKQAAFEKELPKLTKALDAARAKQKAAVVAGKPAGDALPEAPTLATFDYHYPDVQNLHAVNLGKTLEKTDDDRLMLVEAVPGDYVLYGAGNPRAMMTCMCMGTVGFAAKAGVITDLGSIHVGIAWQASDDPMLATESNLGASVNGHWILPAMGVVPSVSGAIAPGALSGKTMITATYRAIGKFVGPPVFSINRLVPVPGILAYDRGAVVDVASGQVVANQY